MIEEIIARLRTEGLGSFQSDMGSAKQATEQAGKGAAEATGARGFGGMAKQLAVAAGGAVAVKKGFGFLKGAADQAGQLAKSTAQITRTTGMDAKASSAWVSIAKSRGIETAALNKSFVALSRQIQAGGEGSKKAVAGFDALGITQKELGSLNTGEVLARVSDGFAKMTNPAQKAALAQQLFGKQGQTLLPILNSGSDALAGQMAAMEKAGLTIDESGVKKGVELAKTQREMKAQIEGVKQSIGQALLPVLLQLAQKITPVVSGFANLLRSSPILTTAVVGLGVAFAGVLVVAKLIGIIKAFAGAMGVLNAVMAANPIVLVVLALAALVAGLIIAYNKVGWFRDLVNTALGAVVAAFNWVKTAIGDAIGVIKTVVTDVANWIAANWQRIATVLLILMGPIGWVIMAFIRLRGQIFEVISAVVSKVGEFAGKVAEVVSVVVSKVGELAGKIATAAKSAVEALTSPFRGAISTLAGIGGQIIDAIVKAIKAGAGALLSAVKSILPDVGGLVTGLIDKVNPFAMGGIVAAQTGLTAGGGGRVLVGERGPEILTIPSGSRVTPLPPPTLAASQLGGAGSRPIVTQVFLERRMIAEALGSYTADQQAAR